MAMTFTKATKTQARARVALVGPAGSGKTFTALRVARGIAGPDGRVAVVDTEHGSAAKYADHFEFDALALTTFAPATYIEAIRAAEAAGYDVLIIDSLSHAWIGVDGALDQVDKAAKRSKSGNTYTAWRDVTPQHNALVEAMLQCRCHLIVTMRAKTEYVLETDNRGKQVPRKVGMAPVQRDGVEYEFDIVADLTVDDHTLIVTKTRCAALDGVATTKPGEELGETIRAWLTDGAPLVAPSTPPTTPINGHPAPDRPNGWLGEKPNRGTEDPASGPTNEPPAPAEPEFHATPLIEAMQCTADGTSILRQIVAKIPSGYHRVGAITKCLLAMAQLAESYEDLDVVSRAYEKARHALTPAQQGEVGSAIDVARIVIEEALAEEQVQGEAEAAAEIEAQARAEAVPA